jgi:hypothetical protein
MRTYHVLTPLPPHAIDQINRQERERRREDERRLPLELPQMPPPGWKRDPSGQWIRDDGDDDRREDGEYGIVIQM